jgi:hypothetical protein
MFDIQALFACIVFGFMRELCEFFGKYGMLPFSAELFKINQGDKNENIDCLFRCGDFGIARICGCTDGFTVR